MWPLMMAYARAYAPYITLPVAMAIGTVGYYLEAAIRGENINTPTKKESIADARENRQLRENDDLTKIDSLKDKTFVPNNVFRN